jgi:hypothetical protein
MLAVEANAPAPFQFLLTRGQLRLMHPPDRTLGPWTRPDARRFPDFRPAGVSRPAT